MTIEPANLKVMQALEHRKWGLGGRRKVAFRPLLGDGEDGFFLFLFLRLLLWLELSLTSFLRPLFAGRWRPGREV